MGSKFACVAALALPLLAANANAQTATPTTGESLTRDITITEQNSYELCTIDRLMNDALEKPKTPLGEKMRGFCDQTLTNYSAKEAATLKAYKAYTAATLEAYKAQNSASLAEFRKPAAERDPKAEASIKKAYDDAVKAAETAKTIAYDQASKAQGEKNKSAFTATFGDKIVIKMTIQ